MQARVRIDSRVEGSARVCLVAWLCTSACAGPPADGDTELGSTQPPPMTLEASSAGEGTRGGEASTGDTASGASTEAASSTAEASRGSLSSEAGLSGSGDSEEGGENAADTSASTGEDSGEPGLGPPAFDAGELDPVSHGGTITFQEIGAAGWYPSRRDPGVGPCDAFQSDTCCMARHEVVGDELTPWDADLIMTLRGPLQLEQFAVYQPTEADDSRWHLVSAWDQRAAGSSRGLSFQGDAVDPSFDGEIGTECLVDVATDVRFDCGDGSSPYCPTGEAKHVGWQGSKLFVMLARMPHADLTEVGTPCSEGRDGNWWDAPWVGLSLGELVRSGAFSDCHCYARNPEEWWLGDGCGQFNVFEVVNDNNDYRNLEVFSTNFFGYAGYVGEGPCGEACDLTGLAADVDLIDKGTSAEATQGALASPSGGPGAAFVRPVEGFRYFVILLDAPARTVALAVIHPEGIPDAAQALLPALPSAIDRSVVDDVRELRLPG